MPSDNSCLFTAFGGALPNPIPAQGLRQMIADHIKEHSKLYSGAILGCSSTRYCRRVQEPDYWGGGIELNILSTIFDIQIAHLMFRYDGLGHLSIVVALTLF